MLGQPGFLVFCYFLWIESAWSLNRVFLRTALSMSSKLLESTRLKFWAEKCGSRFWNIELSGKYQTVPSNHSPWWVFWALIFATSLFWVYFCDEFSVLSFSMRCLLQYFGVFCQDTGGIIGISRKINAGRFRCFFPVFFKMMALVGKIAPFQKKLDSGGENMFSNLHVTRE